MIRNAIGDLIRLFRGTVGCAACGHNGEAHLHYRPGSECSLCECARWF